MGGANTSQHPIGVDAQWTVASSGHAIEGSFTLVRSPYLPKQNHKIHRRTKRGATIATIQGRRK